MITWCAVRWICQQSIFPGGIRFEYQGITKLLKLQRVLADVTLRSVSLSTVNSDTLCTTKADDDIHNQQQATDSIAIDNLHEERIVERTLGMFFQVLYMFSLLYSYTGRCLKPH